MWPTFPHNLLQFGSRTSVQQGFQVGILSYIWLCSEPPARYAHGTAGDPQASGTLGGSPTLLILGKGSPALLAVSSQDLVHLYMNPRLSLVTCTSSSTSSFLKGAATHGADGGGYRPSAQQRPDTSSAASPITSRTSWVSELAELPTWGMDMVEGACPSCQGCSVVAGTTCCVNWAGPPSTTIGGTPPHGMVLLAGSAGSCVCRRFATAVWVSYSAGYGGH